MDGGVQVRELPLVSGELAGGVQELLEEQHPELLLGQLRVHEGQGHALEGQIPGRKPGVLPLVGHAKHPHRVQVPPVRVAELQPGGGGRGAGVVALQPLVDVEDVDLLRPEQAREGLALDEPLLGAGPRGVDEGVELVRLRSAFGEHALHVAKRRLQPVGGEAQAEGRRAPRGDEVAVVGGGFGPDLFRVHRVLAVDDVAVEGILDIRPSAARARSPHPRRVGLVVGEEQPPPGVEVEVAGPQTVFEGEAAERLRGAVVRHQRHPALVHVSHAQDGLRGRFRSPGPSVPEPELGEEVEGGGLRAAVVRDNPDDDVLGRGLGVLHEDVEVAVVIEDPGVKELELRAAAAAPLVLLDEPAVGILPLGILVEPLHVGVGGRGVEVEVALLHVLPVVALRGHEAEEAFLEDGIALVPEGEGEYQDLVAVTEAGQAVLAPAEGPAPGVVVRERIPGRAVRAVVLADGPPRPLRHVGPPAAPAAMVVVQAGQPLVLPGRRRGGHP